MWKVDAKYYESSSAGSWSDFQQAAAVPDVLYDPVRWADWPIHCDLQRRGIRILLDGVGSDEIFTSGLEFLTDLMRRGRVFSLAKQLRSAHDIFSVGYGYLLSAYCIRPFVPDAVRTTLRPVVRSLRSREVVHGLLTESFYRSSGIEDRLARGLVLRKMKTRAQQVIYNNLFYGWNSVVPNPHDDLFSGYFGVERRRPFYDQRVVQFVLGLPQAQRWSPPYVKFILRSAMRGTLPESTRMSTSKALYKGLVDSIYISNQAAIEEVLAESRLVALGIVDRGRMTSVWRQYVAAPGHGSSTFSIQLLIGLEFWVRRAIDSRDQQIAFAEGK